MQVYSSLPIATNHPPPEDLEEIPHHLLGFLDHKKEFTVVEFVENSLEIIERIRRNGGRGVVVVGGTGYYISSLLWEGTLVAGSRFGGGSEDGSETEDEICDTLPSSIESSDPSNLRTRIAKALADPTTPSRTLHALLSLADPHVALLRHPNDDRKIRRSLQIFLTSGPQSEVWAEQRARRERGSLLRYRTLLFWTYSAPEKLNPRLDGRVDTMIQRGMLAELQSVAVKASELPGWRDGHLDWTRGIAQAIGFKEFASYLGLSEAPLDKSAALQAGIEATKLRTRRYAKTQGQWLRNKLVPALLDENRGFLDTDKLSGRAVALDVDSASWVGIVDRAVSIAEEFLGQKSGPVDMDPILSSLLPPSSRPTQKDLTAQLCEICTDHLGNPRRLSGAAEYARHLTSRGHKAALERRKEMERNPIYREKVEEEMRRRRKAAAANTADL